MPDPIPGHRPDPRLDRRSGLERPHAGRPDPTFWGADRRPSARARRGSRRRYDIRGSWVEIVRDHVDRWRGDGRVGVAVLIVVAVVVGVAWYRMGASSTGTTQASRSTGARVSVTTPATSAPVRASTAGSLAPSGSGSPATSSKGRTVGVVVHVAGAVVHPGVVELPLGSRVIDAIEAVGGALANADLDRLNLAAKLIDGQRIAVSRVGDPAAPAASASATGNATTDGGLVDLNNATQAQLEALPGVGPQLAMAIIAERDRRGGFRSVNELRTVHGIGDKRFADLRPRVTV